MVGEGCRDVGPPDQRELWKPGQVIWIFLREGGPSIVDLKPVEDFKQKNALFYKCV